MASFNSLSALPPGAGQPLSMDAFDQDLAFDDSMLDPMNGALPSIPFTPTTYDFEGFSTFEDPFSYPATGRPFEAPPDQEIFNDEASPQELDNKLLGFSGPVLKAAPVGDDGQISDIGMTAELYGMFFVAEDVFGGDTPGRPLELTCYRRNLWQCSGQVVLPRVLSRVISEQGMQVPIVSLAASITAVESIEGKATEIISIPWKSAAPPAGPDETKVAGAPPNIILDMTKSQEVDADHVSLPLSWKRLQFKHATANNGRRKGLQQHYVVQISLLGRTQAGDYLRIAEIQSGPVIVRGRSPRNFDSRKDVPLTGDKKTERRATVAATAVAADASANLKTERDVMPPNLPRYHSMGSVQPAAGDWGQPQPWGQQSAQNPAKKMAMSPNVTRPPVPSWSKESTGSINSVVSSSATLTPTKPGSRSSAVPSVPINLSLSEDERSPNRSGSDLHSPQFAKSALSHSQNPLQSPMETADMLYEYFPLSLDDWSPPVDAVYRPHAVHHVPVPPEIKAQQIRSKTKRYFAAE